MLPPSGGKDREVAMNPLIHLCLDPIGNSVFYFFIVLWFAHVFNLIFPARPEQTPKTKNIVSYHRLYRPAPMPKTSATTAAGKIQHTWQCLLYPIQWSSRQRLAGYCVARNALHNTLTDICTKTATGKHACHRPRFNLQPLLQSNFLGKKPPAAS